MLRHLLGYVTSGGGIALVDLKRGITSTIEANDPRSLSLSLDGSLLAVLNKNGDVAIWKLDPQPTVTYHETFSDGLSILLAGNSHLVIRGVSTTRVIDLDSKKISSSSLATTTIKPSNNATSLIIGSTEHDISIASMTLSITATIPVCKEGVRAVEAIPNEELIAFACREGKAGIVSYHAADHVFTIEDTFQIPVGVSFLAVQQDGKKVVLVSERSAYVYDIDSRMIMRLDGQHDRISAIAGPTSGFPYLLLADVSGAVRMWAPPAPGARVFARVPGIPFAVRFSPDSRSVAVSGSDQTIRLIRISDGKVTELRGHTGMIGGIRFSSNGNHLMSFSWDGTARLWALSGAVLRIFDGHHSIIEDGDFVGSASAGEQPHVVTIGDDGRLFFWNADQANDVSLLNRKAPLIDMEVLGDSGRILAEDSSSALWLATSPTDVRQIQGPSDSAITRIRASVDGKYLALGDETGRILVYNTNTWTPVKTYRAGGSIADIAFDPRNRDILARSEDGYVHIVPLNGERSIQWSAVQADARDIAYSPNGDLISFVTQGGGCWFYAASSGNWFYAQDHDNDVWSGRFSPDGTLFASADRRGTIVLRRLLNNLP